MTGADFIVWLTVGLLAGSLAGLAAKRQRAGFGRLTNLGLGMVGALIGGYLFNAWQIDLGVADISVSLQDIVSAFIGSLIFLGVILLGRRWFEERGEKASAEHAKGGDEG